MKPAQWTAVALIIGLVILGVVLSQIKRTQQAQTHTVTYTVSSPAVSKAFGIVWVDDQDQMQKMEPAPLPFTKTYTTRRTPEFYVAAIADAGPVTVTLKIDGKTACEKTSSDKAECRVRP